MDTNSKLADVIIEQLTKTSNSQNKMLHALTQSPAASSPVSAPVPVQQSVMSSSSSIPKKVSVENVVTSASEEVAVSVGGSQYYTIFGFSLSKTTVYAIIFLLVVLLIYYVYKLWSKKKSVRDNKNVRIPEVSYDEQMEVQKSKSSDSDKKNVRRKESSDSIEKNEEPEKKERTEVTS